MVSPLQVIPAAAGEPSFSLSLLRLRVYLIPCSHLL